MIELRRTPADRLAECETRLGQALDRAGRARATGDAAAFLAAMIRVGEPLRERAAWRLIARPR